MISYNVSKKYKSLALNHGLIVKDECGYAIEIRRSKEFVDALCDIMSIANDSSFRKLVIYGSVRQPIFLVENILEVLGIPQEKLNDIMKLLVDDVEIYRNIKTIITYSGFCVKKDKESFVNEYGINYIIEKFCDESYSYFKTYFKRLLVEMKNVILYHEREMFRGLFINNDNNEENFYIFDNLRPDIRDRMVDHITKQLTHKRGHAI